MSYVKVTADLQPTGKTEDDVRDMMESLLVEVMADASNETS